MSTTKHFRTSRHLYFVIALACALLLAFGRPVAGAEKESTDHYKMLSSVEYSGQTQFRNQVETILTARKSILPDNKVKYFISSADFDLSNITPISAGGSRSNAISFIMDRKTGFISGSGRQMALLERISNECVTDLTRVTEQNVGKTWKQSFHLSSVGNLLPGELRLTLTATSLESKLFGKMIAVRALSEPFVVRAANAKKDNGIINARINTVYLFDSQIQEVYLALSVFQAQTTMNGFNEELRYEVATYRTDAAGTAIDLSGLDSNFSTFAAGVGLSNKGLKIQTASAPLPQWAQSVCSGAAQAANICAATACEGGSNQVATIYVPATQTSTMQSLGRIASMDTIGTVNSRLAADTIGIKGMRIAAMPKLTPKSALLLGGTTGIVLIAAGGGGGGGGSSRSPSVP